MDIIYEGKRDFSGRRGAAIQSLKRLFFVDINRYSLRQKDTSDTCETASNSFTNTASVSKNHPPNADVVVREQTRLSITKTPVPAHYHHHRTIDRPGGYMEIQVYRRTLIDVGQNTLARAARLNYGQSARARRRRRRQRTRLMDSGVVVVGRLFPIVILYIDARFQNVYI